jgi:hypothetical protein
VVRTHVPEPRKKPAQAGFLRAAWNLRSKFFTRQLEYIARASRGTACEKSSKWRFFGSIKYMKMDFVPKSRSGKWAVGLGFALVIFTELSLIFAAAIGGDSAVIEASLFLSILANVLSIMFSLAGPLSFFVGMYTIIKHKEWAVWKPLAALYILTLLLFLCGEFLFPH